MNFPDKKIYRRRYKYCWLIEIIYFLPFLPLIFKIIPKIRIFHDIQKRSEARIKKKKKLIPRGTFGPKRRRDRERVPRHFLGSPRGKWLRVTDRPRESSFPRCEMERRPGPKNDQRQIFRALCSLPAIQRDPKTRGRGAAWKDRGKGRRANIASAWPISLRHYDLRSVVRPYGLDPLSLRSQLCIDLHSIHRPYTRTWLE